MKRFLVNLEVHPLPQKTLVRTLTTAVTISVDSTPQVKSDSILFF